MAGPCSVESREQILLSAKLAAAAGAKFLRGGAYKPRSSPYSFQGMGVEGLKLLREVRRPDRLLVVNRGDGDLADRAHGPLHRPLPGGRAQHAELQPAGASLATRARPC